MGNSLIVSSKLLILDMGSTMKMKNSSSNKCMTAVLSQGYNTARNLKPFHQENKRGRGIRMKNEFLSFICLGVFSSETSLYCKSSFLEETSMRGNNKMAKNISSVLKHWHSCPNYWGKSFGEKRYGLWSDCSHEKQFDESQHYLSFGLHF